MFANLKNKIREETGGDLPQLGPKNHGHGRLSRGSKGGSTSSMCSEQDTSSLKAIYSQFSLILAACTCSVLK